jgi:hypothetical protein
MAANSAGKETKVCRIGRADGDHAAHQVSHAKAGRESERKLDADDPESLADHHAQNVRALRAERHAHADLAGLLAGGVGGHAVHAEDGQHETERAHHAGQRATIS